MSASKKAVSTSATAKLRAAAPAVIAPVTVIPPAPNAHKPADVKTPETFVDQSVVDRLLSAVDGVGVAVVDLFMACVVHRVSPKQFHTFTKGTQDKTASQFNCAHYAGLMLGHVAARKLIETAASKPGDKRDNILAALRAVKTVAKEVKPGALKGAALSKEIAKRANVAVAEQAAKQAARNTAKRGARTPTAIKAGTLAAFQPLALAALMDLQKQLAKVNVPTRKLAKVKDFSDALAEAIDALEACE